MKHETTVFVPLEDYEKMQKKIKAVESGRSYFVQMESPKNVFETSEQYLYISDESKEKYTDSLAQANELLQQDLLSVEIKLKSELEKSGWSKILYLLVGILFGALISLCATFSLLNL